MALIFITRPNVHLITFPQMNKQTNQQKTTADGRLKYGVKRPDIEHPATDANLLSPSLRADLYRVNVLFQHQEHARKCRTAPDAGSVAQELEQMVDEGTMRAAESWIGPVWTYILRDQGSYSGLKVAELCQLLDPGLFRWYLLIYGPQSNLVHASNAIIHAKRNEDSTLGSAFLSPQDEVQRVLMVGCLLFCLTMSEMENNIGFGPTSGPKIESLRQELLGVFHIELSE